MVRIIDGRTPERHDGVADVLVERTAVPLTNHGAHCGEVLVDVVAQGFGAQAFGNPGEAADIGEQIVSSALLGLS